MYNKTKYNNNYQNNCSQGADIPITENHFDHFGFIDVIGVQPGVEVCPSGGEPQGVHGMPINKKTL